MFGHARRAERLTRRVHLVASLGGHLELLHALAPVFSGFDRVWVTSAGARADRLAQEGEQVRPLPRLDRSSLRPSSLAAGFALAVRERPSLVVSTGAGIAVPFALVGKVTGARLVFVETMARVRSGSLTGRIFSLLGATVLVQWPDLLRVYPRARVCSPTLLDDMAPGPVSDGTGTFVTVGSHDAPFERLLAGVESAAAAGVLPRPVRVQTGVADRRLSGVETVAFLTPEEFRAAVSGASVVVTHGGAGAIAAALRHGRTPVVVPRRADLGEHVDDHQAELVAKLAELGLVVESDGNLDEAVVARALDGRARASAGPTGLPTVAEALQHLVLGGKDPRTLP